MQIIRVRVKTWLQTTKQGLSPPHLTSTHTFHLKTSARTASNPEVMGTKFFNCESTTRAVRRREQTKERDTRFRLLTLKMC